MLGPREDRELVPDHRTVAEDADERGDVGCGPEQPGVSGDAPHRERVLVMDLAAQAPPPILAIVFGRRAALAGTRSEVGGLGLDGAEDALAHEIGEGRAADLRKTGREHDVAEVAVRERADVLRERLLRREPDGFFRALGLAPERLPPGEPGGVREDAEQRHAVLAGALEVGHELAERGVQRELALADERQQQRGGRELGERREVEHRIDRAGRVGTGTVVRTERPRRERLAPTLALDAHDARREERANVCVDDRRGRGDLGHVMRMGGVPLGRSSPARTAASASRLTGTSP